MNKTTYGAHPSREIMLYHLKRKRGDWVSGQFLGEQIAMTRTAVWKQIGALKKEGYVIASSPRKGYRLLEVSERMLISEIRDGLKTRIIGRGEARHYEQTDSTNNRAKEMAARGAAEGTLVIAEGQTKGRGRRDRRWFSPPAQGIYASLILRPSLLPSEASRLVLLTSVAVVEALIATTALNATIKWPNDILVGGRKIAGILIEIATEMDAVDYAVIGLGVNVNIPGDQFPEEFRPQATSIFAETGKPFSRVLFLRRFLESFECYYDLLQTLGLGPIMTRWKEMTDMLGKRVSVRTIGGHYTGKVVDVDQDGFLILRDEKGDSMRIVSGDVTIL